MTFNNRVQELLEDFNIFPKDQTAIQSGPDAGITTGDIDNTFPSKAKTVAGKLLPNKKDIKKLKKQKFIPKEKPPKIRLEIR